MSNTQTLSGREQQQLLNAVITISGDPDWEQRLKSEMIPIPEEYVRLFGASSLSRYDVIAREAELNDVSFERGLLSEFLTKGYTFEELEIELRNDRGWGKMVWYPDHPNYHQPPPDIYETAFEEKLFVPEYYFATFKVENGGDKEFCLYSTQMFMSNVILLHKTILFRKVVLALPKK